MAGSSSPAAYYRAHAQVFALALEMGVTPKEAEAVLAQRAARVRWVESERRLEAAIQRWKNEMRVSTKAIHFSARAAVQSQPWMMRD